MKLLHTSDWHVGKHLRGKSRIDEHRAVLAEIVEIVVAEAIDLVVVAGDLFDSATPTPESQELVYRTLLDLARSGAQVAVIAGNHDNARALRAVRPVFAGCGVQVVTHPTRPEEGGLFTFVAKDGAAVDLALLPFVSQRGIVTADDLMTAEAADHAVAYADRLRQVITSMCVGFHPEKVNVLATHAFVLGAQSGGGERPAHLVESYAIQAAAFPAGAGYVALGHLHRAQRMHGATSIHYCGSPLQLDFSEVMDRKQVNVVEMNPGRPARVTTRLLASGRPLRVHKGSLDQLMADVPHDDAWLRLIVTDARRAGLADSLREQFGERVVDVIVESSAREAKTDALRPRSANPVELFAEFLATKGVDDERVNALFHELLDDAEVQS